MSGSSSSGNDTMLFSPNRTFDGLDYGLLIPLSSQPSIEAQEDAMPVWAQLAWSTVFLVMILTATGGNCIVIWIVIAHRRMRTVTNYFLVNLSTADLLLTTFNCMFNFIYMLQRSQYAQNPRKILTNVLPIHGYSAALNMLTNGVISLA